MEHSSIARESTEAPSSWVSLGQASRILGVNQSTLRRWADEGRIRSFRTPGSHRRFSVIDLQRLQEGRPATTPAAGTPHALDSLAVARIRQRLRRGKGHEANWYSTLDEEGRLRFRPLGRRLVSLVAECVQRRTHRGRLVDEARGIGHDYGQELARDSVSLRDAVEAFTFFRRSLDDTTRQLAQREHLSADDAANAWDHVSGLADVVLLALVEAYEAQHPLP